ncbi:MAG: rod shape-determining protein RodA [Patescibacteria group bacterium]|nr:rod shape-determining protein RodA [Patescibacteria group bacterium]
MKFLQRANLRNLDLWLLIIILILIGFSLITIYSLDLSQKTDFFYFKKQLIFSVIGIVCFFAFALIDYKILKTYSYAIYLFALTLLILVLFFGKVVHGTRGWFAFYGISAQPVEFAKIAIIITLARFLSMRAYEIKKFLNIFLSAILLSPTILLTLLQPDLGSAIILLILWIGMLFIGGMEKKHLFLLSTSLILCFCLAWFFSFKDYQKDRILTFLNPSLDPLASGYNVIQSTIAVGSGKLFGRGISSGSQSQLQFLPEAHTDFIFSSLAEGLGLIGAGLLLFLFVILFYKIIKKLKGVSNDFGIFLVSGILIYFISQIFLNIAMNIGIAPVMGIPLPLISYGGSSLIVSFIMLGIIANVLTQKSTLK